MMGFDSRRGLRVLVAVGSNSPPDCYSLPPLFESLNSYSQDLLLRYLYLMVEMMGFDSRRGLRVLVAVGSNSPPDCYSLPPLFESLNSYSQDLLLRYLYLMVEMMGFEPMTPCLQGRCSPN